jgi:hypothetical protein
VSSAGFALAQPAGKELAVYVNSSADFHVSLNGSTYQALWMDPQSGQVRGSQLWGLAGALLSPGGGVSWQVIRDSANYSGMATLSPSRVLQLASDAVVLLQAVSP